MNNVAHCHICDRPVNDWGRLCDDCLRNLLADFEAIDDEPEPISQLYTILPALTCDELCQTRGIAGLMQTMPQLPPDIYEVRLGGLPVADATRSEDGTWTVDFHDGMRLAPGYIIV